MEDPELDLDDLTDSIASIRLGLREVPAAAVAQAGFVKAEAPAATERREQNRPATWQHKKQLSRQADASAKAWSEFKAAGTGSTGGGVFGSKVSFQVGAKKSTSSRQKTHTRTPLRWSTVQRPQSHPRLRRSTAQLPRCHMRL